MARILLALLVPEAEPLVASFREQHDPSARRGLGAHITLSYPFVDSELFTSDARAHLREVMAAFPAPMFRLARVDTFPSVVWLAPEPSRSIVAIAEAVERAFPDHPKGGGAFPTFVPHLSVARGMPQDKAAVVNELQARLSDDGPVYCWCEAAALLVSEQRRWRLLDTFAFLH